MLTAIPEKETASPAQAAPVRDPRRFLPFTICAGLLLLAFSPVLLKLVRYSLKEDLYSHILLIPFISGYLIWQKRFDLPQPRRGPLSLVLSFAALTFCILCVPLWLRGESLPVPDSLFFSLLPLALSLLTTAFCFLGPRFLASILFPIAFLGFMIPFPEAVTNWLEIGSQKASAEVYSWMMYFTGATYYREGQVFVLPGLTIQVAQECSGIRSSFVLFITSLLAGYMFLRAGWKRALFAFIVIPLGFLRNAFRVYVISMLSAHVAPWVINSPLHHSGGPIFFALSLIPFFALLLWLKKTEKPRTLTPEPQRPQRRRDLGEA